MDHRHIDVFLTLADELHFGRTAQRLHLSQSRVSRLVSALEREVGAALFERTSRKVRLTPLGADLLADLQPAQQRVRDALERARSAARSSSGGSLCVGFTATTEGEALDGLIRAFEVSSPHCPLTVREISLFDNHAALRSGEIDVLVNWQLVDEPDLTVGPVLHRDDRVVAVAAGPALARRAAVSVEDLADFEAADFRPALPAALSDAFIPPASPTGRPIRRTHPVSSMAETFSLVARSRIVHPTVASMSRRLARDDIVLVPITDLPALPLGLVWCTAHENARIRALAQVAARHAMGRRGPAGGPVPGRRRIA